MDKPLLSIFLLFFYLFEIGSHIVQDAFKLFECIILPLPPYDGIAGMYRQATFCGTAMLISGVTPC